MLLVSMQVMFMLPLGAILPALNEYGDAIISLLPPAGPLMTQQITSFPWPLCRNIFGRSQHYELNAIMLLSALPVPPHNLSPPPR